MNDLNELREKDNDEYLSNIIEAKEFLRSVDKFKGNNAKLAISLGSGLEALARDSKVKEIVKIPYSEIPHFPHSNEHAGEFILAEYKNNQVILLTGGAHFYESVGTPGFNDTQASKHITLPIRVLKTLGIESLLLSKAAGGLDTDKKSPYLMLDKTFIPYNFKPDPTLGTTLDLLGPRFTPLGGDECDPKMAKYLKKAAEDLKIKLEEGVYAMVPGRYFESAGDCRAIKRSGGDAVGFSKVPETIAALHGYSDRDEYRKAVSKIKEEGYKIPRGADYAMARRINVISLSYITNTVSPDGKNIINHEKIIKKAAKGAAKEFVPLVKKVIGMYYAK